VAWGHKGVLTQSREDRRVGARFGAADIALKHVHLRSSGILDHLHSVHNIPFVILASLARGRGGLGASAYPVRTV
jgi:hypothetical protein